MFNPTHNTRFISEKSLPVTGLSSAFCLVFLVFVVLMLSACVDIELNLSSKKRSSCYNISVCHWNLNSITTHNFAIIDLLQADYTVHQYYMYLSEPHLDGSASSDNDNLSRNGYKLVRAEKGNICVYFKEFLPVRCLPNSHLKMSYT